MTFSCDESFGHLRDAWCHRKRLLRRLNGGPVDASFDTIHSEIDRLECAMDLLRSEYAEMRPGIDDLCSF